MELSKISKEIANSLAHGAPCFSDVNMPEAMISSHNLILVGTPDSNRWLGKIYDSLPVKFSGKNMGYMLIYPNPINPEKYVAVFSSTSSTAMMNIPKAYQQMMSMQPSDVGIFEVIDDGNIKWHIIEWRKCEDIDLEAEDLDKQIQEVVSHVDELETKLGDFYDIVSKNIESPTKVH